VKTGQEGGPSLAGEKGHHCIKTAMGTLIAGKHGGEKKGNASPGRCRLLEFLEEGSKIGFQDEGSAKSGGGKALSQEGAAPGISGRRAVTTCWQIPRPSGGEGRSSGTKTTPQDKNRGGQENSKKE